MFCEIKIESEAKFKKFLRQYTSGKIFCSNMIVQKSIQFKLCEYYLKNGQQILY